MTNLPENCPDCILVADDDPAIRRLIVATLRREGYDVHEARNGREALAEMRSGEATLIVLDLMMPEISGWQVLEERRKDPNLKKIPVIVITANNGPGLAQVVQSGICAMLPKPFNLDDLHALVRSCLEGAQQAASPNQAISSST